MRVAPAPPRRPKPTPVLRFRTHGPIRRSDPPRFEASRMRSKFSIGRSGAERRAAPRVPVSLNVRFSAGRIEGIGSIRDLSLNGAYIAAAPPHPQPGTPVNLFLPLGRDGAPVEISTEVVRRTPTGFAVRFLRLDQHPQDLLIAFLQGLEGKK